MWIFTTEPPIPQFKNIWNQKTFPLRGEGKDTLDYIKSPTYVQAFKYVNVLLPRLHCIICSKGYIELNPSRNQTCDVNIGCEWNCSLPSISYCWPSFSSTISHVLFLLQSLTLLTCSLNASPCMLAVVLHFSRSCTVRFKMFSLLLCFFFNVLFCVKSIINVLQFRTIYSIGLVGYQANFFGLTN